MSSYTLRYQPDVVASQIQVGESTYHIDFNYFPTLKQQKIEQLRATYDLNFSGLRSITRRDGFGSEFLVIPPEQRADQPEKARYIIDPLSHRYPNNQNPNIHQARYLAATLVAEPQQFGNVEDILTRVFACAPMIPINMNRPALPIKTIRWRLIFLRLMDCGWRKIIC